jgi:Pentapeptide repeats (8 copies)
VSPFRGTLELVALIGENAAMLALLLGAINYIRSSEDRKKQKHYAAWQVIIAARGQRASGGRLAAVRDLAKDRVSLHGIDLSGAFLDDIVLQGTNLIMSNFIRATLNNADLSHATMFAAVLQGAHGGSTDFSETDLSYADLAVVHFLRARFTGANLGHASLEFANLNEADLEDSDLDGADLQGANLQGANLSGIRNWQSIRRIRHANILSVRNAPEGFREWAFKKGAEEIPAAEWMSKHEASRDKLRNSLFEFERRRA